MAVDALAVANYFLDKAQAEGKTLSPMSVQKLVYFAHGWHLAILGQPLINERVQAWNFGPVIPVLYHNFKEYGKGPITGKATEVAWERIEETDEIAFNTYVPQIDPSADPQVTRLLDRVWDVYKKFSAFQLSNLTHVEGSPWDVTRKKNPQDARFCAIDDSLIRDWFRAQAQANKNVAEPAQQRT